MHYQRVSGRRPRRCRYVFGMRFHLATRSPLRSIVWLSLLPALACSTADTLTATRQVTAPEAPSQHIFTNEVPQLGDASDGVSYDLGLKLRPLAQGRLYAPALLQGAERAAARRRRVPPRQGVRPRRRSARRRQVRERVGLRLAGGRAANPDRAGPRQGLHRGGRFLQPLRRYARRVRPAVAARQARGDRRRRQRRVRPDLRAAHRVVPQLELLPRRRVRQDDQRQRRRRGRGVVQRRRVRLGRQRAADGRGGHRRGGRRRGRRQRGAASGLSHRASVHVHPTTSAASSRSPGSTPTCSPP